jgi:hypothetical protein
LSAKPTTRPAGRSRFGIHHPDCDTCHNSCPARWQLLTGRQQKFVRNIFCRAAFSQIVHLSVQIRKNILRMSAGKFSLFIYSLHFAPISALSRFFRKNSFAIYELVQLPSSQFGI